MAPFASDVRQGGQRATLDSRWRARVVPQSECRMLRLLRIAFFAKW